MSTQEQAPMHEQAEEGRKVVVESFTPDEVELWWGLYNEEFGKLTTENPCRQGFNREEFEAAINDSRMAKLAYEVNGEIVALCLLSNNFEHFPWLSEDFFRAKYGEKFDNQQVHYFVSLMTRADKQGQKYGSRVVEFITELYKLDDNEAVITFDCCAFNSTFLPQMIEAVVEETGMGHLEFEELGTQHYYGGQLHLK